MRRIVNIELDVRKEVHNKISFSVNQYDDVTMRAKLYDGLNEVQLSDDDQIILTIKKQDGKYVTQDANMVREGNTLIIDWSKQCSNVEGVHELELAVKDKNGLLTTAISKFMVKKPITTGIVDIVQSTDDIHLLFEIKEFLDNCDVAMEEILIAIDAINVKLEELEASLQGEFDKLVIELRAKKDELIVEIGNKKDEFIGEVNTAKDTAIKEIQDNVDLTIEQAIQDLADATDAGLAELELKIQEGQAIVAEIQQIKDTLATKQELSDVNNVLQTQIDEIMLAFDDYATLKYVDNQDALIRDRINQVNNRFAQYTTLEDTRKTYEHLENKKADKVQYDKLAEELRDELKKKANVDDVARIYATHAELEATEEKLQDQIDAITGGAGGYATIQDLEDAYNELDKLKADKTELADAKTELKEYTDIEITKLETLLGNEIDAIERDFATKAEVTDTYNVLDNKKADKAELQATETKLQTQIDALTGIGGGVASLEQLEAVYDHLEDGKADRTELEDAKTELKTYIDNADTNLQNQIDALEPRVTQNETDIADIKTNFVSDVKIEDGMLKHTKNGVDTDITKVISTWGDLEYVDEYKYSNLFDKTKVEAGRHLNNSGALQTSPSNLDWGVITIPLAGDRQYTVFKKTNDNHFKISMRNADGNVVGNFINQAQGAQSNGWYKHVFTTHADTSFIYMEVRLRVGNSGKEMLIEGDIPTDGLVEIPYLSDNKIRIQKGVTLEFDRKTSNMTSVDVNSAILELDTRITNLNIPTDISTLATDAEVEAIRQALQANIDLKANQTEITRIDAELATKATKAELADYATVTQLTDTYNDLEARKADKIDFDTKADRVELEDTYNHLIEQIDTLQASIVEELEDTYNHLNDTKADKTELDPIKADIAQNRTDIDDLKPKVEKNINDIANINTDLANKATVQQLEDTYNELSGDIADLVTVVGEINTNLEDTYNHLNDTKADKTDIEALTQRVDTNTADITNLKPKVAQNETDIADIKENYVSDVKIENGTLKKTVNGTDEDITPIISKWGDLEYVDEYPYVNLLDVSKVQTGKALNANGGVFNTSADWGVIEIPITGGATYTVMKKTSDNNLFKISMRNASDTVVGSFISQNHGTADAGGWFKHTFTTEADATKIYMEVRLNLPNTGKEMLIEGTITDTNLVEIPYMNGRKIKIKKDVLLEFDRETSTMVSTNVNDAILELNTRITNLNVPPNIDDLATDAEVDLIKQALEAQIALKADQTEIVRLEGLIDTKADKTSLDNLATITELEDTYNALVEDITEAVVDLQDQIDLKADVTEIARLEGELALKANQTEITRLEGLIDAKADKTALDALATKQELETAKTELKAQIDTKVETTRFNEVTKGLNDKIDAIQIPVIPADLATKTELGELRTYLDDKKADKTELERVETELGEDMILMAEHFTLEVEALQTQIDNIDITDMATQTQLNQARTALQQDIDTRATKAEIADMATKTELQQLNTHLDGKKADKTALTALEATVATKANQSDLTALTTRVTNVETNKADKTELTRVETELTDKIDAITNADFSQLATKTELNQAKTELTTEINKKASQTDLDALKVRVTANEGNITNLQNDKADKTALATKADTTALEQAKTELNSRIDAITVPDISDLATKAELQTAKDELQANIDLKADITELENYITDVKVEDKVLKYTKASGDTGITPIISKWGDLEHVTENTYVNLLDKSKIQPNKAINNGTGSINQSANSEWGIVEVKLSGGQQYTLFKKTHINRLFKVSMRKDDDSQVQYVENDHGTVTNGWFRTVITTHAETTKAYIEVKLGNPDAEKLDMVIPGDVPFSEITEHIPYINGKKVKLEKELFIEFDKKTSNMVSGEMNDAILELNNKIDNLNITPDTSNLATKAELQQAQTTLQANIDTKADRTALDTKLSTINSVAGTSGNIDLELSVNGDNLEFKVGGQVKHTITLMTDAQADEIIALFV